MWRTGQSKDVFLTTQQSWNEGGGLFEGEAFCLEPGSAGHRRTQPRSRALPRLGRLLRPVRLVNNNMSVSFGVPLALPVRNRAVHVANKHWQSQWHPKRAEYHWLDRVQKCRNCQTDYFFAPCCAFGSSSVNSSSPSSRPDSTFSKVQTIFPDAGFAISTHMALRIPSNSSKSE